MSKNVREKIEGAVETAAETARETKDKIKETSGETTERARMMAEDAAHRAGEWAKDAGHRAQETTDTTIASVGKGMSNLAGTVRERAPAEGVVGSAASSVAEQLEAGGRYLQEHGVGEMADDLTRIIQKNPVPSLLVAFGVGFLAGSVLRR